MLISINSQNTPTPATYIVTPMKVKKTVANSKGDEFVYVLNTKYKIELSWLPMNQEELTSLLNSMSSDTFSVTFFNHLGVQLTKTFRIYDDYGCEALSHINDATRWKPLKIVLKEV